MNLTPVRHQGPHVHHPCGVRAPVAWSRLPQALSCLPDDRPTQALLHHGGEQLRRWKRTVLHTATDVQPNQEGEEEGA